MQIPPPITGRLLTLDASKVAGLPLRTGQVLDAVVDRVLAQDRVLVQVAGRLIEARTPLSLLTGQALKLEVESAGPPPRVRVVVQDSASRANDPAAGRTPAGGPRPAAAATGDGARIAAPATAATSAASAATPGGAATVHAAAGRLLPRLVLLDAPAARTAHSGGTTAAAALRPGQVITAMVQGGPAGKDVHLQLPDGREVALRPGGRGNLPLEAGQSLRLRVEAAGTRTLLAVVDRAAERELTSRALRTLLPRQESLQPLLRELARLPKTPGVRELPMPVKLALASAANLPRPAERLATPDGLREAIANSGLFLEARLLNRPRDTGGDSKAVLLRLAAALLRYLNGTPASARGADKADAEAAQRRPPQDGATPRPGQPQPQSPEGAARAAQQRSNAALLETLQTVLRQSEGNTARQQVAQLQTVAKEDGDQTAFAVELPVRHRDGTDTLELKVRQEGGTGGSEGRWSVTLNMDDPRHGPLAFVVTLAGGAVSTSVWAERAPTADLFRGRLGELRRRFEEQGLQVGTLAAYIGTPPRERDTPDTVKGLLDLTV